MDRRRPSNGEAAPHSGIVGPVPPRRPDITEASIVFVGKFNPTIFQPQWFASHNLIPAEEADTADIKIIHAQVCHFETESLQLHVTTERFMAISKAAAPWLPLRDVVVGTFSILEHCPVTAMGMSRQMHFAVASTEEWRKIGDALAPKEGWNSVLGGRPGLMSLTVLGERRDLPGNPLQVEIQPSTRLGTGRMGVRPNKRAPRGRGQE